MNSKSSRLLDYNTVLNKIKNIYRCNKKKQNILSTFALRAFLGQFGVISDQAYYQAAH